MQLSNILNFGTTAQDSAPEPGLEVKAQTLSTDLQGPFLLSHKPVLPEELPKLFMTGHIPYLCNWMYSILIMHIIMM